MPEPSSLLAFAAITLGMALTPGPNMVYLISRSICQERTAGLISLGAVALSFVFYMLCAAFGITAFVMVVPYAYAALRLGGAAYLLYLAWQAVRPGGRSPFQIRDLPDDEKAHWRAMFDHYVFANGPDVTDHIPEAARGVLAPLTTDTAGRLRAFLLRALSR